MDSLFLKFSIQYFWTKVDCGVHTTESETAGNMWIQTTVFIIFKNEIFTWDQMLPYGRLPDII